MLQCLQSLLRSIASVIINDKISIKTQIENLESLNTFAAGIAASIEQPLKLVDYSKIFIKSRFPNLPGLVNGSTAHSSVYLYSSKYGKAARNDALWTQYLQENNPVLSVINGLSFQDQDMEVMFNKGPNSTLMFYLASSVSMPDNSNYNVIHRTFPGLLKNSSTYDSTQRTWFSRAPEDAFYMYGPYKETFTKELVVTLSSRKTATVKSNYFRGGKSHSVTTVSAAVLLLKDLASIVNSVEYPNSGFGVLIAQATNQVLVWGNRTDVFNEETQSFKTVADFDEKLASLIIINQAATTLEYTDSDSEQWYVSTSPFLSTKAFGESVPSDALSILVFAKKSDVEHPLLMLQDHISSTTTSITIETLIIIGSTIGLVMLLVAAVVFYISHPLSRMIAISRDIVAMSAEEEDKKNYTDILSRALANIRMLNDEVNQLAADYYHIVCLLNNRNVEKNNTPKFPENPFHSHEYDGLNQPTTLNGWFALMARKNSAMAHVTSAEVKPSAASTSSHSPPVFDGNLDVLSTMSVGKPSSSRKVSPVAAQSGRFAPSAPLDELESGIIELPAHKGGQGHGYASVSKGDHPPTPSCAGSVAGSTAVITAVPTETIEVTAAASLMTQLLFLCALLLAGSVATMIATVVSLHDEGQTWMDESSVLLFDSQLTNLQAITDVKAVYVQSYFQQLTVDLLMGAEYVTSLASGNLTRSDFIAQREYLTSYSIDSNNPYAAPTTKTYNYSSYFVQSDNCQASPSTCDATQVSNETRLTSLVDLRFRSYFHAQNVVNFVQLAVERDGYTRYLPYAKMSTNANPTTCQVNDPSTAVCQYNYQYCSAGVYKPYDPRCRAWYQLAADSAGYSKEPQVYFQYPGKTASGVYALTAVAPLHAHGAFYGVLGSTFLVTTLSNSINALKILDSGYVYLIDNTNTTRLIIHPSAGSGCKERLSQTQSDREGNLVVVLLEQNRFAAAFQLLERLLISDKTAGYVKGCVVKQGTLGQYYLKQGETSSAEKVFLSALDFVRKTRRAIQDAEDTDSLIQSLAAEQIALFNIALLREAQKRPTAEIESAYIAALVTSPVIHMATTTKVLLSLRTLAAKLPNGEGKVRQIDQLAAEYCFNLTTGGGKGGHNSGAKTVAFVVDYSGSMSGSKIRSAVDNLCSIIDKHMMESDSLMVVRFNQTVSTVLSLQQKGNHTRTSSVLAQVRGMNAPTGSTALYTAINLTLAELTNKKTAAATSSNNWMVVLTDGADNHTGGPTVDAVCRNLATHKNRVNVIVIGVGSDVQVEVLERIAKSGGQGVFISAASDKRSIDAAFAQVATLIQESSSSSSSEEEKSESESEGDDENKIVEVLPIKKRRGRMSKSARPVTAS
eukprot:gene27194-33882_t